MLEFLNALKVSLNANACKRWWQTIVMSRADLLSEQRQKA